MPDVSFKTLGCRLNQAETESIAADFKSRGWNIVKFGDKANAVVINSCTVTGSADSKSTSAMNRAIASIENGLVIITGCFGMEYKEKLEKLAKVQVVDNRHKTSIPRMVEGWFSGTPHSFDILGQEDIFGSLVTESVFRTRAMIKVQDGCNNFCSYCIIPHVRGRPQSRSIEQTVHAVKEAVANGYRELVLTGVNMSRWTSGTNRFSDLLEHILQIEGDFRLRLGSVEPERIDEGFIDLLSHPKMTSHLHLCLQSGSDKILKSMRRQYTVAQYEAIVEKIRQYNARFNITTDVIVGFPGELQQDFEQTASLCQRQIFGHIHTFPYSRRRGTLADKMDGHVPQKVKKERSQIIRSISIQNQRKFYSAMIGSNQKVLVEKTEVLPSGILAKGRTSNHVPVVIEMTGAQDNQLYNRIVDVQIHGLDDEGQIIQLKGFCIHKK